MNATPNRPDDDDEIVAPPAWLEELRGRANSLFDNAPEPTETSAIRHDRFDEALWQETRANVESVDNMIREYGKEEDYVDDFFQDFFNLMHKADPQLRSQAEMKPSHAPNQAMIEHFSKYSELQDLRQYTQGDQYGASMGILSMQSEIDEAYTRMAAAREAAERAQELAQAAAEAVRQAQEALSDPDADQEAAQAALDAAEFATGQAAAAQSNAQQQSSQAAGQSMNAIRSAAQKAADDLQEEQELMYAFGVEPGELQRMDFNERYQLAKRLRNNRLAKFAKLIGQFRHFARAEQRRRVKHVPDEITGLTLGDDLTRLHPNELINLAIPELEDQFWARYADHALSVWELTGTERMGRGPIIYVCDESGSMGAEDVGASREAWAKAFALALCDAARRDNRDFIYIGFSSEAQQWTAEFPGGRAPLSTTINMTEHFYGGGTHYQRPLVQALNIVKDYGLRGLPKPDIVFVTDDEYAGGLDESFVHEWLAQREALSMKVFGIGMGINPHRSGAMVALCDNVRSIDRMANDVTTVADIFRAL